MPKQAENWSAEERNVRLGCNKFSFKIILSFFNDCFSVISNSHFSYFIATLRTFLMQAEMGTFVKIQLTLLLLDDLQETSY